MRLPRTIGQGRAQKVLLQLLAGLFLCLKAQAQYPFVGELAIVVDRMLADPVRPRIYALTTESNTLRVINTDSLQVTKVIPLGPEPWNMALSPDNSTLYIAEKGSAAQGIAVVNLNTLAVTSYLATPDSCLGVAAGADNHLYFTTNSNLGDYNLAEGTWNYLAGNGIGGGWLAITPDRTTLIRADFTAPATLVAFDLTGGTPVFRESLAGRDGFSTLVMSPDGKIVSFRNIYTSPLYSTANVSNILADLRLDDGYAASAAFSADSGRFFQAQETEWTIAVFNLSNYARIGTIRVGGPFFGEMVADASGKYLFVAISKLGFSDPDHVEIYGIESQITSALIAIGHRGQSFSYQIQADSSPTSYSASGLPEGLTFNAQTGLISGTPTQSGAFAVALSATGVGTVNATLTLEVDPYTGIYVHYDVGTTDIDLGREQTFVPPASSFDAFGNPSEVHAIAVLPDVGLATVEFHAAEGNHLEVRDYPDAVPVIFGENQAAPQFALGASAVLCEPGALEFNVHQIAFDPAGTLQAFRGTFVHHCAGSPAVVSGEVFIGAGSVVTSPLYVYGQVGFDFSYQLKTDISAPTWEAIGLPPGLSLDPATGIIAGSPTAGGKYPVSVTARGAGATIPAVDTVTLDIANARKPLNISTRLTVGTGENVAIAGFFLFGGPPKNILIRGIGPSLAAAGISNTIPDPVLELHNSDGTLLVTNDNWKDTQEEVIAATGAAPNDEREAAMMLELQPVNYTAILKDKNNAGGVGLVEVYDLEQESSAKLSNLSTRGHVGLDDAVMIGGVIVGGTLAESGRYVVRALGPSLAAAGVNNPLSDPVLDLYNGDGNKIASNDDWEDWSQQAEIKADNLAPTNSRESAMVLSLGPGNYTAIVRGAGSATGIGLVEIYYIK